MPRARGDAGSRIRRASPAYGPTSQGTRFDLLAADYALATFGSDPLTPGEHLRAVSRWQVQRRRFAGEPRRLGDREPFRPRERALWPRPDVTPRDQPTD